MTVCDTVHSQNRNCVICFGNDFEENAGADAFHHKQSISETHRGCDPLCSVYTTQNIPFRNEIELRELGRWMSQLANFVHQESRLSRAID